MAEGKAKIAEGKAKIAGGAAKIAGGAADEAKRCSHAAHEEHTAHCAHEANGSNKHGLQSFVYRSERPFTPNRLAALVRCFPVTFADMPFASRGVEICANDDDFANCEGGSRESGGCALVGQESAAACGRGTACVALAVALAVGVAAGVVALRKREHIVGGALLCAGVACAARMSMPLSSSLPSSSSSSSSSSAASSTSKTLRHALEQNTSTKLSADYARGIFRGIVRSKGFVRVTSNEHTLPDQDCFYWSHAGRRLEFTHELAASSKQSVELVVIGRGLDHSAISAAFDSALLL